MQPTSATLYGKGVFTTVAVHSAQPFLFEWHWRRLTQNAAAVGIDLSEYSSESVTAELLESIRQARILGGKARLTFFDHRMSELWTSESVLIEGTTISVLIREKQPIPDHFSVSFSPFPVNSRSPLAGVKSCNYLEQIMAKDEAKARGFHEAIRVNENGKVTSACMSNVFWLKGERLFTPALSTGCLAGTTREFVLETLDCDEVEAGIDELNSADAIYLTSAGLGIVRVAGFDCLELADLSHPIQDLWPV